jgi:hypothetical protein
VALTAASLTEVPIAAVAVGSTSAADTPAARVLAAGGQPRQGKWVVARPGNRVSGALVPTTIPLFVETLGTTRIARAAQVGPPVEALVRPSEEHLPPVLTHLARALAQTGLQMLRRLREIGLDRFNPPGQAHRDRPPPSTRIVPHPRRRLRGVGPDGVNPLGQALRDRPPPPTRIVPPPLRRLRGVGPARINSPGEMRRD